MSDYFIIRKWKKHLIKRFGKQEMHDFGIYFRASCPCMFLDKVCNLCKYNDGQGRLDYHNMGCIEARKYDRLDHKIKVKIKRRL